MRIADVLLLDYDAEIAKTRRILELIPQDKPDWKPHEKSMAIGRLAFHTAKLPHFGSLILTTPELDMAKTKMPQLDFKPDTNLVKELEDSAAVTRKALQEASDEHLLASWRFSFGDKLIMEESRAFLFRTMYFNHQIHHRSQLGVYLRLLDIPLPAIYGPSADDRMGF